MPTLLKRDSTLRKLVTGAILALGMLVALVVLTPHDNAFAELQGTIAGHAFSIEGSETGATLAPVNRVDLPPGGTASDPMAVTSGSLTVTGTANTDCSGNSTGDPLNAACFSTITAFSLSINGTVIATADTLDAQSSTSADGVTVASADTGTSFANLCIQQTALPDPCTIITVPGPVSVNIPGVAVGTIIVQDEVTRTTEGEATGSGLTVTMLHVDLAVAGSQDVLDIAQKGRPSSATSSK